MIVGREDKNPKWAASLILNGGVLICPAFTIYGFSASLFDVYANKRIAKIKRRGKNRPFIVIAQRAFILDVTCCIDRVKLCKLLEIGCTVIAKTSLNLPEYVTLNGKTAFRVANTPILEYICSKTPITSTSVNVSGSESLNSERQLIRTFSSLVDGFVIGKIMGEPSTIVELDRDTVKLIRKGYNSKKIMEVL